MFERDQEALIAKVVKLMKPEGVLYFSTNKRNFKMEASLLELYRVKNITKDSIPVDIHDHKIHHCYEIKCIG